MQQNGTTYLERVLGINSISSDKPVDNLILEYVIASVTLTTIRWESPTSVTTGVLERIVSCGRLGDLREAFDRAVARGDTFKSEEQVKAVREKLGLTSEE